MSLTQAWLGRALANSRGNPLVATGLVCLMSVVCMNLRLHTERSSLGPHQAAHPVTTDRDASHMQCGTQSAAAIGAPTGGKGGF